ncbi:MAG: HAD hydrolase family protein [Oleiphilaceae bacterium]|nr:HAD hydrolase family protein [Oleiphilaceae bacterium]
MLPQPADRLREQAARVRLLVLDVDGVMSDGQLTFTASGDELKSFNVNDGLGIKQLMGAGIQVAIITGRVSPLTARRAQELGIDLLIQGRDDKRAALGELADKLGLAAEHIAYMGDDLQDLAAIQYAGLGVTVPNGHWFVRQHADHCTEASGGRGAVRELADLILLAQNRLEDILKQYLEGHS